MKKLTAYLFAVMFCLVALLPAPASADVNDFTIHKFSADYVIDSDKVGGSMLTSEKIDLTFTDQNHGILRAIPQKYRGYSTKLNVLSVERDGVKELYSTYTSNDNLVLKIGDANKTITGPHSYKIVYTQERIINFQSVPEFYWDVNGTDWQQPFESVEATVRVEGVNYSDPMGFPLSCYTGTQGSLEKDCSVSISDGAVVFKTNRTLQPFENLSIELPVPPGMFAQPTTKDKLRDHLVDIIGLATGLAIIVAGVAVWWRKGRDYRGKELIIPEYGPPKDLTPAEVGMLADYKVDGRDMSATLIDLAVRGYVKLHEDVKKFLFFKSKSFKLELMNPDFNGLKKHEKALLDAIFKTKQPGEIIELGKIDKAAMQTAMESIRKDIKAYLTDTYGFFETSSQKAMYFMYVAGVVLFVAGFLVFSASTGFGVGLIIAGVVYFLLGTVMQRRSHAGVETYEKIKGLELYMKTAEKDRLKMMQSVDRPYAAPSKTVELFEKLLPFAVALGVEKSWAKQFDDILTKPPGWYNGSNINSFNAGYLASSLTSATQSFSQSFESSSGSSGGSGGGGGGGGGGGW